MRPTHKFIASVDVASISPNILYLWPTYYIGVSSEMVNSSGCMRCHEKRIKMHMKGS